MQVDAWSECRNAAAAISIVHRRHSCHFITAPVSSNPVVQSTYCLSLVMSAKKSRFDGLDVAAMTSHVKRTMLGFKLANVYDGNALGVSGTGSSGGGGSGDGAKGVYMFKLADPSGGSSSLPSSAASAASVNGNIAPPQDAALPAGEGEGGTATNNPNAEEQETANNAADQKRAMLLIESGVRFHPTT